MKWRHVNQDEGHLIPPHLAWEEGHILYLPNTASRWRGTSLSATYPILGSEDGLALTQIRYGRRECGMLSA